MSFHEPQRRERKIYLKGNILGSGVKDPSATGVRYSDMSCPGFYKCVAVIGAVVGEFTDTHKKTQAGEYCCSVLSSAEKNGAPND